MSKSDIERQAAEIMLLWNKDDEFMARIRSASPDIIAAVMAKLASTGATGEKLHALRDACNSALQLQLSTKLVDTMVRLNKTAIFLAWVGIALGTIIGIAQIIIPLFSNTK